jgi:hypothetical protein
MSQDYSDPKRANDPHALPDIEVLRMKYADCPHCTSVVVSGGSEWICDSCSKGRKGFTPDPADVHTAWFWRSCFPGCLPDSEPFGPFDTYADALADAQEGIDDADEPEPEDEPADDEEPDEDSITTSDHRRFFQYGRVVVQPMYADEEPAEWLIELSQGKQVTISAPDYRAALRAYMDRVQFFPDVFFISDHGNVHRIDVSEGSK